MLDDRRIMRIFCLDMAPEWLTPVDLQTAIFFVERIWISIIFSAIILAIISAIISAISIRRIVMIKNL